MNPPDVSPAEPPEQLTREAAQWFARMRGPEADACRAAFDTWLAKDAGHRSAYNRAAEIFAMGKLLADEEAPAPHHRSRVLPMAAALCVICAVGSAGWIALRPAAPPELAMRETRDLATLSGERRSVRLADGSTVRLGSGSAIEVRFDGARRQLRLSRGQARFEVAHATRPFVVLAGGGSIVARGTVFDVELTDARRVEVRLFKGAVDVALPRRDQDRRPAIRRLLPGESLSFAAPAPTAPTAAASPRAPAAPAPRDYAGATLAELVAEANHGAERPIRLADATLGAERVSGRFRIDDTERLAQRLAALFGVTADLSDRQMIVLRKR